MQIIDRPKETLLPFNLRKRFLTEEQKAEPPRALNLNLAHYRKNIRLKKLEILTHPKLVTYYFGDIDKGTRKNVINLLSKNTTIRKSKKIQAILLSDKFINNLSENLKPIPYTSAQYLEAMPILQDIFSQYVPIPQNTVLMALGQISQFWYFFFDNCFQIPYSCCCDEVVYLRMEVMRELGKQISYMKQSKEREVLVEEKRAIREIKTQMICGRCRKQVFLLQGISKQFQNETAENSEQKTRRDILIDEQRKKICIGVMIGSGRFKRYRLDPTYNRTSLSGRPDLSTIFEPKRRHSWKKDKLEARYPKTSILTQSKNQTSSIEHILTQ